MPTSRIALALSGALLLAAAGIVQANTLAPAAVAGKVSFNFEPPAAIQVDGFGSFPLLGPGGQVRLDASPLPSPSLYAEVGVGPGFTGRASAQLTYQMQVVAPPGADPNADVGVNAAVAGRVLGSSNNVDPFAGFAMKAQWLLEDVSLGLQPVVSDGIETGALQGSFNQSFDHDVALLLKPSHIYRVTLVADAFAGASSGPWAIATAYIDPVFTFAGGVGPGYAFEFSAGIGNAPIPEPGAWALLTVGLLALGLRMRRRAG
ncbi:PEP-CTERM sorting domain-containing protein [Roseateles sp. P5_E4]